MSGAPDFFDLFNESFKGLSSHEQIEAIEDFTAHLLKRLDTAQIK